MLSALDMINAVKVELERLFSGYSLPNKAGEMQNVKIFAQYMPPPSGITVADKGKNNVDQYSNDDFNMNFPCVLIKLSEVTDNEEGRLDQNHAELRLLFGVYEWHYETSEGETESEQFKSECWHDVLNMMELVRQNWLKERIIGRRFKIEMPIVMNLLDDETWPLYFGEMKLKIITGRMGRELDYVYRGYLRNG